MPGCEKCWRDAGGMADVYYALVSDRDANDLVCTPEQQAGEFAEFCPTCKRKTIHQYAKYCTLCGEKYET